MAVKQDERTVTVRLGYEENGIFHPYQRLTYCGELSLWDAPERQTIVLGNDSIVLHGDYYVIAANKLNALYDELRTLRNSKTKREAVR